MSKEEQVERLNDAFRHVKKVFFPDWDKTNRWFVEYLPEFKRWTECGLNELIDREGLRDRYPFKVRIDAQCQPFRKCVLFYRIPRSENELFRMLIHEICHAITDDGHGDHWVQEMKKIRAKAPTAIRKRIDSDLIKEGLAREFERGWNPD